MTIPTNTASTVSQLSYPEQAALLAELTGYNAPVIDHADIFLTALWQNLSDAGAVSLAAETHHTDRKTNQPKTAYVMDWLHTSERRTYDLAWAAQYNQQNGSIYAHHASRKRPLDLYKRGGLGDLLETCALCADIDCAKVGLPLDIAFNAVMQLPLLPTFVVFSGGGLQVWHTLNQPISVANRELAVQYKQRSMAFYAALAVGTGIALDTSVHEATRMMRLPGFVNRKPERAGAVARIIYYSPQNIYTPEQIAEHAPIIPVIKPKERITAQPSADGLYLVGQAFVAYFIDNMPVSGSRHNTMALLAAQARRGGIGEADFTKRLRILAKYWYSAGDREAWGEELDNVVTWAYHTDAVDLNDGPAGLYQVRLSASGFERVIDEQIEKQRLKDRHVPLNGPPPEQDMLPLPELRKDMQAFIDAYFELAGRTKVGTVAVIAASPGAGKTNAIVNTMIRYAEEVMAGRDPNDEPLGRILYLTLFKQDWNTGKAWVREFVDDQGKALDPDKYPDLFGFLIARNSDKTSKGYCAMHGKAEAFGKKGYNVRQAVCTYCTARPDCEISGYLSQFKELEHYEIVMARHSHGLMTDFVSGHDLIVIDESALGAVCRATVIKLAELEINANLSDVVKENYQQEYDLIAALLMALRKAVATNSPIAGAMGSFANSSNVKLGGYWLMSALAKELGTEPLQAALAIDTDTVRKLAVVHMDDSDVANIPPYYLPDLLKILAYEYRTYYAPGAKAWNSRLIPYGHELHIYKMQPYKFPIKTKIIWNDGTALQELIPLAFTDMQGRPRQIIPYNTQIQPPANSRVYQYLGTETTKASVNRYQKDINKLEVQLGIEIDTMTGEKADIEAYSIRQTLDLADKVRLAGNGTLANLMVLIHQLAARHKGNLLTVMYKSMVGEKNVNSAPLLRRWLERAGIIQASNIAWFGNTRGKNNWKDVPAVLVMGTPRVQEMDLLIEAQVWYWRDIDGQPAEPVYGERMERIIPYMGYVDEHGNGAGYRYLGYKDERVNNLYLHHLQSELRQSADRIRPNSSNAAKYIYLATAFPCTSHVTDFISWEIAPVYVLANQVLEALRTHKPKTTLVRELAALAKCSENTALKALREEYETGCSLIDGTPWKELHEWDITPRQQTIGPKDAPKQRDLTTKEAKVLAYLSSNPHNFNMRLDDLLNQLASAYPGVSFEYSTVSKARSRFLRGE